METQRMFGILREIKPHSYRVWYRGGWRTRKFDGSVDIVSSHAQETDARKALSELQQGITNKLSSGGYMLVHEAEYSRYANTRLSIAPVDVTVVPTVDQELISQG